MASAPLPLSYRPVTFALTSTVASGGSGRCSTHFCALCTKVMRLPPSAEMASKIGFHITIGKLPSTLGPRAGGGAQFRLGDEDGEDQLAAAAREEVAGEAHLVGDGARLRPGVQGHVGRA